MKAFFLRTLVLKPQKYLYNRSWRLAKIMLKLNKQRYSMWVSNFQRTVLGSWGPEQIFARSLSSRIQDPFVGRVRRANFARPLGIRCCLCWLSTHIWCIRFICLCGAARVLVCCWCCTLLLWCCSCAAVAVAAAAAAATDDDTRI